MDPNVLMNLFLIFVNVQKFHIFVTTVSYLLPPPKKKPSKNKKLSPV